jgi:hypothetical protein
VRRQQELALLTAMRTVHLLLLAAVAAAAVLAAATFDVLRLLPLKAAIHVALLTIIAGLAITHDSTPLTAFTGGH